MARWLITTIGKEVVQVLVKDGIAQVWEGMHKGLTGRPEYNEVTNSIIIRWDDGTVTDAREAGEVPHDYLPFQRTGIAERDRPEEPVRPLRETIGPVNPD